MITMVKYIHMKKFSLTLVAVTFVLLSLQVSSAAQGLEVTPSQVHLDMEGGGSQSVVLQLKNLEDKEKVLHVSRTPFSYDGNTDQVLLDIPHQGEDATAWVTVPDKLLMAPNLYTPLSFSVNIPANTKPGGYYVAIVLENTHDGDSISTNVRVVVPLFISVGDPDSSYADTAITGFSEGDGDFSDQLLPFRVHVKNSGNNHVTPLGRLTFYDDNGVKVPAILDADIFSRGDNMPFGGGLTLLPGIEREIAVDYHPIPGVDLNHLDRATVELTGTGTVINDTKVNLNLNIKEKIDNVQINKQDNIYTISFQNTGNIVLHPSYSIEVADLLGNGSWTAYGGNNQEVISGQEFKDDALLDLTGSAPLIKKVALLVKDATGNVLCTHIMYVIAPFLYIVLGLSLILILAIVLYLLHRNRNSYPLRRHK